MSQEQNASCFLSIAAELTHARYGVHLADLNVMFTVKTWELAAEGRTDRVYTSVGVGLNPSIYQVPDHTDCLCYPVLVISDIVRTVEQLTEIMEAALQEVRTPLDVSGGILLVDSVTESKTDSGKIYYGGTFLMQADTVVRSMTETLYREQARAITGMNTAMSIMSKSLAH